ncbi:MAG: deoxyribonuclease IV [Chlorobium sp.]|jgi:deoxyribonuclease-4|uniref:deoxyribonuclease IV n=1 Tax=Chlorobium sp. TaxID=1095 RepID=UPI001DB1AF5E|nr:deoxyribonuclease IV [Chlorobium sp.]MBN1279664.1 deoxyribonuclease IV [Chlorobiaceae bacterium]MCF8216267.1 deoxyribonuclease IV [Chlorobium sp.]MCF8271169.1 deoxyribonuclease IV [Chlorobium sp.]MCF8287567.1 deoxyribonuclease IV [Chlorobium sp.]MCF8291082.1 deoxyribonuclease IV [Chlorobium sp.]
MKRVGAHVSIAGGVENAPLQATRIGAKAFALFTKNQRQWKSPELGTKSIEAFRKNCSDGGFLPGHILPHDSYLINLGSPEPDKLERSRNAFFDEMLRVEQLGLSMLNFHPGSHLNQIDPHTCIRIIAESINMALDRSSGVTAVIENTAGQGSNIGRSFEELGMLIKLVNDKTRVGICLDTCHLFAGGYDIRTKEALDKTLESFDRIVGLPYLKALHLNDAKQPLGSRLDRHESIGKGAIGKDTFTCIMRHPLFEEIPLILETPDSDGWEKEIRMLYELAES